MLNFKFFLWSGAAARQDDVLKPDVWGAPPAEPSGAGTRHPQQEWKRDAMLLALDTVCSSPPGAHTTELVCQLESGKALPWPTGWKCIDSSALYCIALAWGISPPGASPSCWRLGKEQGKSCNSS